MVAHTFISSIAGAEAQAGAGAEVEAGTEAGAEAGGYLCAPGCPGLDCIVRTCLSLKSQIQS